MLNLRCSLDFLPSCNLHGLTLSQRQHPFVIHTRWGACRLLSSSQWSTSLGHRRMLLSTEPTQTGNHPLLQCIVTMLPWLRFLQQPSGQVTPCLVSLFTSHLTLHSHMLAEGTSAVPSCWVQLGLPFFGLRVCEILVSQPGIESSSPALQVQSPHHWTTREVLPVGILTAATTTHKLALFYHPGHFLTSLCSLFLSGPS